MFVTFVASQTPAGKKVGVLSTVQMFFPPGWQGICASGGVMLKLGIPFLSAQSPKGLAQARSQKIFGAGAKFSVGKQQA